MVLKNEFVKVTPLEDLADKGTTGVFDATLNKLDKDFPGWKNTSVVIPAVFKELKEPNNSGLIAEKAVFDCLEELSQKSPMVIMHSVQFKEDGQNRAEADFIVLSKYFKPLLIEVKLHDEAKKCEQQIPKVEEQFKKIEKQIENKYLDPRQMLKILWFPNLTEDINSTNRGTIDVILNRSYLSPKKGPALYEKFQQSFSNSVLFSKNNFEDWIVKLAADKFIQSKLTPKINETAKRVDFFSPKGTIPQKFIKENFLLNEGQRICFDSNHHELMVYGPAGSGKTLILELKIISLLKEKNQHNATKSLIVCKNKNLQIQIQDDCRNYLSLIDVLTIGDLRNILKKSKKQKSYPNYQHIFVDEAEDIDNSDIQLLNKFQNKIGKQNYRWYFSDPNQSIIEKREWETEVPCKIYLHAIMRSTINHCHTFMKFFNTIQWPKKEIIDIGHQVCGPNIRYHVVPKSIDEVKREIDSILDSLCNNKISTRDIVVLTTSRGINQLKCICEFRCVRLFPIHEFKGLESKIVIFYAPWKLRIRNENLYLALSRSYCMTYVISNDKKIGVIRDYRWAEWIFHLFAPISKLYRTFFITRKTRWDYRSRAKLVRDYRWAEWIFHLFAPISKFYRTFFITRKT